ncbi:hypothetical protein KI659_07785 [Litoribacter alkaliphilus]|uniref:SD-repeat containing protein B domain-containing protein n=1 Tax=Litoribacter ruber TaxID=702568 RepID=A0AAP2G4W6_9BACT|nr:hypothetical protein [Litoribacter alkaliphilus]MBS9523913.1 hypothetical protein [Litoribacter alkaliphilus]
MSQISTAQQFGNFENILEYHFSEKEINLNENDLGLNRLIISNPSPQAVNIKVQLLDNDKIRMISDLERTINIGPGQQIILPIRFSYRYHQESDFRADPVSFQILMQDTQELLEPFDFVIKTQESRNWRANLANNQVLVQYEDMVEFELNVQNRGNRREEFTLRSTSQKGQKLIDERLFFALEAKRDTLIRLSFPVAETSLADLELDQIRFSLRDGFEGKKEMTGNIQLVGSEIRQQQNAYYDIPLTMEVQGFRSSLGRPMMFLNLAGSIELHNDQALGINMRTDGMGHLGGPNSLYQAHYRKGDFTYTAGTIIKFTDFLINGYGAGMSYHKSDKEFHDLTVSQSRMDPLYQVDYSGGFKYAQDVAGTVHHFANYDYQSGSYNYLFTKSLQYQINRAWTVGVSGGYSNEFDNFQGRLTEGHLWGYEVAYQKNGFSAISQINNYSDTFIGINRGFSYQRHQVRKSWKNYELSAFHNQTARRPMIFTPDSIYVVDAMQLKETGVRNSFVYKKARMSGTFSYMEQRFAMQAGPMAQYLRTAWTYNYGGNLPVRFSLNSALSYVTLEGLEDVYSRIAMTNNFNLSYRSFGIRGRVDRGPNFYNEVVRDFEDNILPQRIQAGPYVDFTKTLKNGAQFSNNTQAEYFKDNVFFDREMLFVRNSFRFNLPKAGFYGGLSVSLNMLSRNNSFVNFNLGKKLSVPTVGIRKYHDLKLKFFKDENRNGVWDAGEEVIANEYVMVNGRMAMTDAEGVITYKNVEDGKYTLEMRNMRNLVGWVPARGVEQHFTTYRGGAYGVPFIKSKFIKGSVRGIHDDNQTDRFNPQGMKVNVVNEKGEQYETIVNSKGEFLLNVPSGRYIVTLSSAGLSADKYQIENSSQSVDLLDNGRCEVHFTIRQKARDMNIRRISRR